MYLPVLTLALQLAAPASSATSTPQSLAPGTTYDPSVPTPQQVLGHDLGDDVSSPEALVSYFEALSRAVPSRTRLVRYGRTWEGRPLVALVIASAERIAAIDRVKEDLRRLADPRSLPEADAERLVRELPVVVALIHGVHGNEPSSGGAAMGEAYHLLAARHDAVVDLVARDAVVIIDPAQNPDGRARFVHQHRIGRGAVADADPVSAEHDEPWPGGRSNHYLFDLNRDWFALTQPESRGRVGLLLEWMPHVVADLHEMGGDSTYYFPPSAPPGNPHATPSQRQMLEEFGRSIAAAFDARGFAYFNREVFDSFYPGYGVSWPIAHGAIGMTFEQASARGLVYRRRDGTSLTYWDGIIHHFTSALHTAETAARHRERMLRDFLAFRRSAVREGEAASTREYLLTSARDPGQSSRLAALLVQNGIEVRQTLDPVTVAGRTVPAGAFAVSLAQPAGRLVRNLLDGETPMDRDFVAVQEARRRRRLPDQIYDVTAWSLPLLWDVEAIPTQALKVRVAPFTGGAATVAPPPVPKVAFLLPWTASSAAVVTRALGAGMRISFSPATFTLQGRAFSRGTAIVRVHDNAPDALSALARQAVEAHADIVGVDSAFSESGPSLGSGQVFALTLPRVLLAWDAPTRSLSAGWARFVLERRYGLPVHAIRVASLDRADLGDYDVVVLPAASYGTDIGGERLRRLRDWVTAGGTLVTIGEASRWATRESVALLDTSTELAGGAPDRDAPAKDPGDAPKQPFDYDRAITPAREMPDMVPGAILAVQLDDQSWLSSGFGAQVGAMVESQRVFRPLTLDKGVNVGVYARHEDVRLSGIVWDESRRQIARKAYLMLQPRGRGRVIAFAEDPNARAFAEATQLLFVNAVLLGGSQ